MMSEAGQLLSYCMYGPSWYTHVLRYPVGFLKTDFDNVFDEDAPTVPIACFGERH